MWTIYHKEINSFLNSLIAYVVIGVFLTGIGLLTWVFESNVLDYGFASLETLFALGPYMFMFLVPAITMKAFAEEKKTGTIELLFTRPFSDWQVIMGKYLASFTLVFFAVLPTLVYYYSVYQLGNPVGNLDTPGIIGSYIGLLLLGGVFAAIGVLSSGLTNNQIVAFIVAVSLSYLFYGGLESIAALNVWGDSSLVIQKFGIIYHYNSLSKGLLDSRDIIYFLSVIAVLLLLTNLKLNSRKW
ncbi:MAG: gliding motility-associated ABC transporter permease subunit GldF [Bacteroidota bacterium]